MRFFRERRELLDILDEHDVQQALRPRTGTVTRLGAYKPCRYPDGTRDHMTESLDVLADALSAPAKQAAAPESPDAA